MIALLAILRVLCVLGIAAAVPLLRDAFSATQDARLTRDQIQQSHALYMAQLDHANNVEGFSFSDDVAPVHVDDVLDARNDLGRARAYLAIVVLGLLADGALLAWLLRGAS